MKMKVFTETDPSIVISDYSECGDDLYDSIIIKSFYWEGVAELDAESMKISLNDDNIIYIEKSDIPELIEALKLFV